MVANIGRRLGCGDRVVTGGAAVSTSVLAVIDVLFKKESGDMDNQEERKPHRKESLHRHRSRLEILLIGRDGKTLHANYLKIVVPLLAGILVISLAVSFLFARQTADRREETAGGQGDGSREVPFFSCTGITHTPTL